MPPEVSKLNETQCSERQLLSSGARDEVVKLFNRLSKADRAETQSQHAVTCLGFPELQIDSSCIEAANCRRSRQWKPDTERCTQLPRASPEVPKPGVSRPDTTVTEKPAEPQLDYVTAFKFPRISPVGDDFCHLPAHAPKINLHTLLDRIPYDAQLIK